MATLYSSNLAPGKENRWITVGGTHEALLLTVGSMRMTQTFVSMVEYIKLIAEDKTSHTVLRSLCYQCHRLLLIDVNARFIRL